MESTNELDVERALIEAAAAYVRARHGFSNLGMVSLRLQVPGGAPVNVSLHPARWLAIEAARARAAAGYEGPGPPRKTIREIIVEVLKEQPEPIAGYALARRCGTKYNPYFRGVLANLQEGPEAAVVHVDGEDGGYVWCGHERHDQLTWWQGDKSAHGI